MRRSRIRVAFCVAGVLGVTGIASGHPGHFDSAVHAHSLADAKPLAQREGKLVFLHVSPPNGRGSAYLRWPTEEKLPLLDLLVQETVIVELNAKAHGDALRSLKPNRDTPTLYLLGPDGSILERVDSEIHHRRFEKLLIPHVTGDEAIERITRALDRLGADHYFTRERLALACTRSGEWTAAQSHFAFCLDRALASTDMSARSRRARLFDTIARLPDAEPAIRRWKDRVRDQVESQILASDDYLVARDWAIARKDRPEELWALFNRLPRSAASRRSLCDAVFDRLIEAQRYAEILELFQPLEALQGEIDLARHRAVTRVGGDAADLEPVRGTARFAIERGAGLIEAVAARGDDELALRL
ncbi:MAG: hypothetical protein KDA33_06820, partial [Phycisphaerales bacterium]|nr:hypothetical protein [Phycisphaerales bacterium]